MNGKQKEKAKEAGKAAGFGVIGATLGAIGVELAGASAVGVMGAGAGFGAAAGPVGVGAGALLGLATYGVYRIFNTK